MKLGVVGKGGTGKTTLSALVALVALAYVAGGRRVLAVDTDSNPNLALSLGLDETAAESAPLVPRSLVVGPGPGGLTPAQLVAEYGLPTPAGVTLLHAMRVDQAGAGCTCASHASVRSLLGAAVEDEVDLALVDMEAGLEHLSRSGATLAHADVLLMVMEPTLKSVLTAARTMALAEELPPLTVSALPRGRSPHWDASGRSSASPWLAACGSVTLWPWRRRPPAPRRPFTMPSLAWPRSGHAPPSPPGCVARSQTAAEPATRYDQSSRIESCLPAGQAAARPREAAKAGVQRSPLARRPQVRALLVTHGHRSVSPARRGSGFRVPQRPLPLTSRSLIDGLDRLTGPAAPWTEDRSTSLRRGRR